MGGYQNLWEVESQDWTQASVTCVEWVGRLNVKGKGEEGKEDDAIVLSVTAGWEVEIFAEQWMLSYRKLEEEQV